MTHGLIFFIQITNNTERSIQCAINGRLYKYFFADGDFEGIVDHARKLYNHSPGRSLAWIKKICSSWEKL